MVSEIRADHTLQFLLPPAIDDWVPEDHMVRFIRDFVSSLDLHVLGFAQRVGNDGRPNYSNDLLLSVWLYGYMERIRSHRKLEHACRTHLPLIWLTGMNYPDHNTLWRFWRDHKRAIRNVFRQSVRVAQQLGMVGMVVHALDGSKIAVQTASKHGLHRDVLERLNAEIEASLHTIESALEKEAGINDPTNVLPEEFLELQQRKEAIRQALETLDKEEQKHYLPDEPEARMMHNHGHTQWSYNGQALVDDQAGIIVAQEVTNEATDYQQLSPMLEQARETTSSTAKYTVADCGYRNSEQEEQAHSKGYTVIVPEHGREKDDGAMYHHERFTYDEDRDCYVCPHGNDLPYSRTIHEKRGHIVNTRVYRCRSYKTCPHRTQCSEAKFGRTIVRHENHVAQQRRKEHLKDPEKRKALARRKAIVESVFGWIKENFGFRRFTAKGLEHAKAQWSMLCLVINLKKIYEVWKIIATEPDIQSRFRAHAMHTVSTL